MSEQDEEERFYFPNVPTGGMSFGKFVFCKVGGDEVVLEMPDGKLRVVKLVDLYKPAKFGVESES